MNLLSKITDALRGVTTSVESVREALDLARTEEARAAQAALDAETAAIDPLSKSPDEAADTLRRAELEARRAAEARRRLEERLSVRIKEVSEDGRRATYDAALKARDAAVDAIAKRYPKIAADLFDIIRLICEANVAIEKANADLPSMADGLVSAETFARGLDRAETRYLDDPGAHLVEMVIPNPDPTFEPLWHGVWGKARGALPRNIRLYEDEAQRAWEKRAVPFKLQGAAPEPAKKPSSTRALSI